MNIAVPLAPVRPPGDDVFQRYTDFLRRGHQLAAEGKVRDALGQYEAAAQLARDRARPHVAVGDMLLRLGRAKNALAAYDRALKNEPADLDALSGRAAALLSLGRRSQAAEVTERLNRLRVAARPLAPPTAEEAALSGAEALHAAGERALRSDDAAAAVDAWLGESRAHVAAEHLEAAMDACLQALSVASGAPRVHLELARIYFRRGWRGLGAECVRLLDLLLTTEPQPDSEMSLAVAQLAAEHKVPLPQRAA